MVVQFAKLRSQITIKKFLITIFFILLQDHRVYLLIETSLVDLMLLHILWNWKVLNEEEYINFIISGLIGISFGLSSYQTFRLRYELCQICIREVKIGCVNFKSTRLIEKKARGKKKDCFNNFTFG